MSELVKNRSEIVFLYDIKDANPNGDPLDENKPRIDEETGINIVTDVRLKRTIRDYLMNFKNEEIFIREIRNNKGKLKTKEDRLTDLKIESPYNTYLYYGLPPGPINNPGINSIMAALFPAKTKYIFFAAKGNGRHKFSITSKEHAKAHSELNRLRNIERRKKRAGKDSKQEV